MLWAAILHHWDDNVDSLYHCNVFWSLFSVSDFSSFKGHIFQGTKYCAARFYKEGNLKVYIFLKESILTCFTNS